MVPLKLHKASFALDMQQTHLPLPQKSAEHKAHHVKVVTFLCGSTSRKPSPSRIGCRGKVTSPFVTTSGEMGRGGVLGRTCAGGGGGGAAARPCKQTINK